MSEIFKVRSLITKELIIGDRHDIPRHKVIGEYGETNEWCKSTDGIIGVQGNIYVARCQGPSCFQTFVIGRVPITQQSNN